MERCLAGIVISELGKEPLGRLILRAGVDPQHLHSAVASDLLSLLHQGAPNACAVQLRIDRKPMHHNGGLMEVPPYTRVFV